MKILARVMVCVKAIGAACWLSLLAMAAGAMAERRRS
jgi:hypothetical protein